jgi:hypothetical protein
MNYTTQHDLTSQPSSLTLSMANREVLRITADGRLVAGEGLSAEEATQEAAKLMIASFEEQIQKMVETRIAAELAAAQSERDLAITRVASILWSGAIDKHTCGDVQQWVTDYTAELARLRAEVERLGHLEDVLRSSAADMTAGSITAGGVAALRAENERLRRAYVRPDDIKAQLESAIALAAASQAYDCAMAIHGTVLEDLAAEREKVRVLRDALENYQNCVIAGGTNPARAALAATKEDSP